MKATELVEFKLQMNDGFELSLHITEPVKPKAIVLIGNALGVSQFYYFNIAKYLTNEGFAVITHEYRGTGKSYSGVLKRDFDAGFIRLGADFNEILNFTKSNFPQLPICLLGHSLGGIIPLFAENINLVLSSFFVGVQSAYYKDFGFTKAGKILTASVWHLLVPFISSLYGFFPGKTLGFRMQNIPLRLIKDVQKRRNFVDVFDYLDSIKVKSYHEHFKCELMAVTVNDDPICTPKAMMRLLDDIGNFNSQSKVLDVRESGSVGHCGFFKKKHEANLWPQVNDWFSKAIDPQLFINNKFQYS